MSKTIKYTGTELRWPELSITGKQSTWMPGQQEERADGEAALLLATGLFTAPALDVVRDAVSGKLLDAKGNEVPVGGGGGGSGPLVPSSVLSASAATPETNVTAGAFTVYGDAACTGMTLDNQSGVDIDYQRNGAGGYITIPHGQSREIEGITNANQIGVRRSDYANPNQPVQAVTVRPVLKTVPGSPYAGAGILNRLVTSGGGVINLASTPLGDGGACEIINNTGRDFQYRTSPTAQLTTLRTGDSAFVPGITNLNQIGLQPVGAIADARTTIPIQVEYFTAGLTGRLMGQRPVVNLSDDAFTPLGAVNIPSDYLPLPMGLYEGEKARGPKKTLIAKGARPLAIFTTVAAMFGNAASACADVTTGDILYGASAIEFTQANTGSFRMAPSAAVGPINCTNGMIRFNVCFPAGTTNYSVNNSFTLAIELFSAGTPDAPGAALHRATVSPSTHAFLPAAKVSPTGMMFSFSIPITDFQAVSGGATLTAVTWAQFVLTSGAAGQAGSKFRPLSIEFVPNSLSRAFLVLSNDDFNPGVFLNALPILSEFGIPMTLYADPATAPGRSGILTPGQLDILHNKHGWQIAGQNYDGQTVNYDSTAQAIRRGSKFHMLAMAAGWGGDLQDHSYGSGSGNITNYREDNRRALKRIARSAATFTNPSDAARPVAFIETMPVGDAHQLRRYAMNVGGTNVSVLDMWKNMLDMAVAAKGLCFLGSHSEFNAPGVYLTALRPFCQYARSLDIDIGTLEQAFDLGYR